MAAQRGKITTLVDNVRIDDDPTSYTSDELGVSAYNRGYVMLYIDSTLSPTTVQVEIEGSDGEDNWYPITNGFLGVWIYEDTATASGLYDSNHIELPSEKIRCVITGTGTDATNYFDVTVKIQPYNA